MYGGFEVFKIWLAVKLHFTTKTYDYFTYGGKVNCKLETFTKRNDRYFFHKLSKKYDAEQVLDFFVANFLVSDKAWIGNLAKQDGTDNYNSHRAYTDSFSYNFRSECRVIRNSMDSNNITFDDLFSVDRGQHPPFFKLLSSKNVSYQTFCVFENFLGFIKNWDKNIAENVVWPVYSKRIKKYLPFIRYNRTQMKLIMKEELV
jgi:hypothetical protein|tara:strand:+ start:68 stop:673 length:606 start_codon:yes stop_codon:yes gene_type:complete